MPRFLSRLLAWLIDQVLYFFVSFITGVRPKFEGDISFSPEKKVYFANHASHGDFVMVWISLPKKWRKLARPVAGADYWLKGKFRRFIINNVFNGLLIMRNGNDPKAINMDDDVTLLPFKSGIYHLARENPDVQFVPIWIDNINRVLPKGKLIPVPIICEVNIGKEIQLFPGESKDDFLQRARDAMLALAPEGKRLPAPNHHSS